ncbi:MAG: radical SAM protein [Gammaproteobacteria bacterium]
MRRVLTRVQQIPTALLDASDLSETESAYRFRVPTQYLDLIDFDDPNDPIRKLVIPDIRELRPVESLDPTKEAQSTVAPGLQHKFPDTGLLLCTTNCAAYCRFCFRKRLFQPSSQEVPHEFSPALLYIAEHPEITNVILSGGDALAMKTSQLINLLNRIADIASVRVIRIGSKTPAFDPARILRDSTLIQGLEAISERGKQLYLMAHFDHPREVTREAKQSVKLLARTGLACLNQCPLLRGVNTDNGVLGNLFEQMEFIGCPQYYVFHCRPTDGNEHFMLPLDEAFSIFERESHVGSGLSKTARYCITHPTGKIQVLALEGSRVLLKYLQACDTERTGRTFWHPVSEVMDLV